MFSVCKMRVEYVIVKLVIFAVVFGENLAVDVFVDTGRILRKTDEKFLSVAIDSGVIRHNWETFQPR